MFYFIVAGQLHRNVRTILRPWVFVGDGGGRPGTGARGTGAAGRGGPSLYHHYGHSLEALTYRVFRCRVFWPEQRNGTVTLAKNLVRVNYYAIFAETVSALGTGNHSEEDLFNGY